jgi:NAD(P)-dependent dehydrogenase (short-subunit alcohol dehydrogenase family)
MYFEAPLERTSTSDWERTLDVNLKETFLAARAALPHLRASAGRLIAISSTSGVMGEAGLSAYCASKWGVRGLVATILEEAGGDGVRATTICPGFTATPMAGFTEDQPELVAIEDVAETVRWLLRLRPVVEVPQIVLNRLSALNPT